MQSAFVQVENNHTTSGTRQGDERGVQCSGEAAIDAASTTTVVPDNALCFFFKCSDCEQPSCAGTRDRSCNLFGGHQ